MLNNHAPIVSLLTKGTIKFEGVNLAIDKPFKNTFTPIGNSSFGLSIESGTIELKDNKLIILAD
jgi:F-type H+-transporting ATPase subunit epsilon